MSDDRPDVRPEDALEVAQRALNQANDAKDELDDLRHRVLELEQYAPDEDAGYHDLDRHERVGRIRQRLIDRARSQHGRAAFDYNDVLLLFDDEPAAGTAYKLMDRAKHASGFDVREPATGNKELVVDLQQVRSEAGFSRVNKDRSAGVGR